MMEEVKEILVYEDYDEIQIQHVCEILKENNINYT